jgi:hypothetical protein
LLVGSIIDGHDNLISTAVKRMINPVSDRGADDPATKAEAIPNVSVTTGLSAVW